jgi:hypothetical protein
VFGEQWGSAKAAFLLECAAELAIDNERVGGAYTQRVGIMNKEQIGRLAMRVEGVWWVAYYAMLDTMEGAIQLGTLRMSIAANPERKSEFMILMRAAVSDVIEEKLGVRPVWPEPDGHRAPEHERSGKA